MKFLPICFVTAALAITGCDKNTPAKAAEATLQEINRAAAAVTMQNGGKGVTTNEVAKFLELSGQTFPTPPAGKQLVLIPSTHKFEFVNQ